MATRVGASIALALVVLLPGAAVADEPTTVGDVVQSVGAAAEIADFREYDPAANAKLEKYLAAIEAAGIARLTVRQAVGSIEEPGPMAYAGMRQERYDFGVPAAADSAALNQAFREVQGIAMGPLTDALEDVLRAKGRRPEEADSFLQPVLEYHDAKLERTVAQSIEGLRKYERKFGPRAPRLNGLEVVLNLLVQNAPNFGSQGDWGPGALELIAAYETSYIAAVDEEPELVSAAEFGIRAYIFDEGWGEEGGLAGILKPGYFSLGVVLAPQDDGPLVWPWEGESRYGAFFSWGAMKVAYLTGDEARVMVTREVELIPWLF